MDQGDVDLTLQALHGALAQREGRWFAAFQGLELSTHFQPIYSFPHRRPVGFEALVRVQDGQGGAVSPIRAFESARGAEQQLMLDRLCRLLHVRNFLAQRQDDCWLFLNIHPAVFVRAAAQPLMLAGAVEAMEQLGMPLHRLVFEVTEDVMAQEQDFESAVKAARATGCLLALDDFGVGHSNFDRIWRMRPEIVKLDRSLLLRALESNSMARVLAQMVALLHECGAMVLLEGVETRDEAHVALDADVDLVQGYAFGRPGAELLRGGVSAEIEDIWSLFDERLQSRRRGAAERLGPFRTALALALQPLQEGQPLALACQAFLALQGSQVCYLLDEQGRELGERVTLRSAEPDPRFAPIERAGDARWARRPYFRRAIEAVGELQVTRPYLSLHGSRLCVTLSVAYWSAGRLRVLCGDVDWSASD